MFLDKRIEKTAETISVKETKSKEAICVGIIKLKIIPIPPKITKLIAICLIFCLFALEKTSSKSEICFLKYQLIRIRIKLNNNRSICINYITIQSE